MLTWVPLDDGSDPGRELAHLSEDVADEWLVKDGTAVNELKQVHSHAVLLHDQHKEVGRLVEVQHLNRSLPQLSYTNPARVCV